MHDLHFIRAQSAEFDAGLARRGLPALSGSILSLDAERRALIQETERLQQRRNEISKLIGQAKGKGEDASAMIEEVGTIKARLPELESQGRTLDEEMEVRLSVLPNLPATEVPDGTSEHENVEIRRWQEPTHFDFTPKEHASLGDALTMMDFSTAAKLSGARFVVLRGQLARLERALGNFMVDLHINEFGYQEHSVPLLVRDNALFGTGQLPKFADDLFQTTNGHWLIPTAEVTLTNLVADTILDEQDLPLRLTAWTPCFRSEAGSAGRDTHGMIRQHQFAKVELVSIVHPDRSAEEHERMTDAAETILRRLGLPYRTMLLCAGDMGFSAIKTYDLEVWLPGQNTYREISSCSNCGDFQARRMKARFRSAGEKGTRFVHTLNGSALAVGRTLIAVLENYQQADGSIVIPDVLRPYMGGVEVLKV